MKKLATVLLVLLAAVSQSWALTVLDFEGIPYLYRYFCGNTNLDGYYAGVNFGLDATILETAVYGYNSAGFPPHSGNAVLFSFSDPIIRMNFTGGPMGYVETWYTSASPFHMSAYDALDNQLATITGPANYGFSGFLSLAASGIDHVRFHDLGNFYVIDDVGYDTQVIPEPATLMLLGSGLLGMGGIRAFRFRRKK